MAKKKKIDPYAAAGIAFGLGKINNTEDILALGGILGAMGAFDDEPETTGGNEEFSFTGESKDDAYMKESRKKSIFTGFPGFFAQGEHLGN